MMMSKPLLLCMALALALPACAEETYVAYDARYPAPGAPTNTQLTASGEAEVGGPATASVAASGDAVMGADGTAYADTDPSALSDFREPLSPYGAWVDDGTYGTVWVPSSTVVGSDFAPYVTGGHWAYDDEYVWVSDYSWGWAPFHYGRWVYIGGRGWSWIPGRTYSGAWVSWRVGPAGYGYVGWAPMPPSWYWYNGYAVGLYAAPPAPYVFCGRGDVFSPVVAGRIVRGPQVATIGNETRPFVPASPSVNGRVGASPSVGDRPGANPSVGSSNHAALADGRHLNAGPSPDSLGFGSAAVPRPPTDHPSLAKARAFSRPETAASLGGTPPSTRLPQGSSVATAPRYVPAGSGVSTMPRDISPPSSVRNPDSTSVATSPRYEGVEPRPTVRPHIEQPSAWTSRPSSPPPSITRPSSPSFSSAPSSMQPASPSYSRPSSPSYARPSAPTYSSPPSYSAPSYSRPSTPSYSSPSSPSFARPSAPTYSRPSTPSYSVPQSAPRPASPAPATRSAPPSTSFRRR
jgi:hypothetical protein